MGAVTNVYGSFAALAVTALQSLANDATDPFSGWQSERVDNRSTQALDYEIIVDLSTANTAPANDQAAYVYLVPWMHNGTTWIPGGNFGTTTSPTGSEGAASISDPNSMRGPIVLPYKVAQQRLQAYISVVEMCGECPDGWSLAIRDCTGAAFGTGCVVGYKAITKNAA